MVDNKMSPQLIILIVSFEESLQILEAFHIFIKILTRTAVRILIMLHGEENEVVLIQFVKNHLYYATTVNVTAVKPLSTSDAAVEPSAVSVIVPLLSAMLLPPSVNTSSSATV